MKNWKTSIFGTLGTICVSLAALDLPYKEYFAAGGVIFGALFALFSKDHNVTGVNNKINAEAQDEIIGDRPKNDGGR